jgi:arabinogalactan oligomer / maltooligosaccharide transport system substrate-binding protein
MKVGRRTAVLLVAVLAAVLSLIGARASTAAHRSAKATTVVIWTDSYRKSAIDKVTSTWEKLRGVNVQTIVKTSNDLPKIREDLKVVSAANAPDVIVGAHDWTGELAANGLVSPLLLPAAVKKQFPAYALKAMWYGGRLYGVPTQLENVGLIVNTSLVKIPKTFAQLEKSALAFKRRASGNVAIAVPQGANGDAYHMYPFFSGLCGYVFGTTRSGALNPHKLGVANPRFLKNAKLIDKWNREGLIDSKIAYGDAKNAFLNKKAAFWITGPWETSSLQQSGIKFRVVQVPRIKCRSVPFLGVQGMFVTKYSANHGVASLAKDLVTRFMTKATAQYNLAIDNSRYPASTVAGRRVHDPLLAQFGVAGRGGVPMPNIPQMGSVWNDLAGAWVKSTKGAGATPAASAFRQAAQTIEAKISQG